MTHVPSEKRTRGSKLFKVNLARESGESLITNSQRLASLVSEAESRTCEEVEAAVEEEVPAVVVDEELPVLDEEAPAAFSNPDSDLPNLD